LLNQKKERVLSSYFHFHRTKSWSQLSVNIACFGPLASPLLLFPCSLALRSTRRRPRSLCCRLGPVHAVWTPGSHKLLTQCFLLEHFKPLFFQGPSWSGPSNRRRYSRHRSWPRESIHYRCHLSKSLCRAVSAQEQLT